MLRTIIKGFHMSKLDLAQLDSILLQVNEMHKNLFDLNNDFLDKQVADNSSNEALDLQEWLEIFAEDEVKMEGCR